MAPKMQPNIDCTQVGPGCEIGNTIYGYYPNLGVNIFFCVFMFIGLVVQAALGIRYKTWTFMLAMCLGTLAEGIGYIGRILLHANPFSDVGFEMQICCLIMAPAFLAAGIYLLLKHIVLTFGEQYSRLRPDYYVWVFLTFDILALILQAVGGGMAASAGQDDHKRDIGTNIMLSGIVWQVATLLTFGILVGDYAWSVWRAHTSGKTLNPDAVELRQSRRFLLFRIGVTIAYVAIFARCVYRIPELALGWASDIMQNEPEFIGLDSAMCAIAVLALTLVHPGFCVPSISTLQRRKVDYSDKDIVQVSSDPFRLESQP